MTVSDHHGPALLKQKNVPVCTTIIPTCTYTRTFMHTHLRFRCLETYEDTNIHAHTHTVTDTHTLTHTHKHTHTLAHTPILWHANVIKQILLSLSSPHPHRRAVTNTNTRAHSNKRTHTVKCIINIHTHKRTCADSHTPVPLHPSRQAFLEKGKISSA